MTPKRLKQEKRKAEKAAMREEIAKHREQKRLLAQIERAEREAARKEAAEAERVHMAEARKASRIRKSEERKAEERAERLKAHEEERMARILAVREKRRLVKEESARLRAENLAKRAEKMKESAERRRKMAAESAAKKRAATRVRKYAEHLAYIEKCRAKGKEIRKSVCKECGQEFEYVVEDWEQRRHNRRAINAMLKSGKTEDEVRKWILNPPEFCTPGCRVHWKYEHGGREKVKAYWQKMKDAGGYWHGRVFVMPKKKDKLVSTWRGNGNFYTGSATSYNKYAWLEDYPSDLSIPEQQDEFQFDEDAEAKNFMSD